MNTNMTGCRGFQIYLHPCALIESSLSIGRVKSAKADGYCQFILSLRSTYSSPPQSYLWPQQFLSRYYFFSNCKVIIKSIVGPDEHVIRLLTLMLLVCPIQINAKIPEKWLKPWQMGTHLRVLSKSVLMDTNKTGFRWFSKIFASLCFGQKKTSALEGLSMNGLKMIREKCWSKPHPLLSFEYCVNLC